jgi:hypothetical protein
MIIIDEVQVSDRLGDVFFMCDLDACEGRCCVEGDLGATLEPVESASLDAFFDALRPFLDVAGLRAIDDQGKYTADRNGYKTPLTEEGVCAYAVPDHGILRCGIEKAYEAGQIDFCKPISCHLYPVRVSRYATFDALNYERWDICDPACALGMRNRMPLYEFVKDALIRRYGEPFYKELRKAFETSGL